MNLFHINKVSGRLPCNGCYDRFFYVMGVKKMFWTTVGAMLFVFYVVPFIFVLFKFIQLIFKDDNENEK